jgi:hypothetical protein
MKKNDKNLQFSVSVKENTAGFRIYFENGYGISVIFGGDSASEDMKITKSGENIEYSCDSAEIAVINSEGTFVPFQKEGVVKSFSKTKDLLKIFSWAMNR